MKSTVNMLMYLFFPDKRMKWLFVIGFLTLIPQLLLRTTIPGLVIWFIGYIALLIIPFILSPATFRNLIANKRLSLVPNFQLKAGLCLFIMTLIVAMYAPLTSIILAPADQVISLRAGIITFIVASIYVALNQLILPSKKMLVYLSSLPWIVFIFASYFKSFDNIELFSTTRIIHISFLCLLVWCFGFIKLYRHSNYKPIYKTSFKKDYYSMDYGWINSLFIGNIHSSGGTLLLGYPDDFRYRTMRAINAHLLTPFFTALGFYLFQIFLMEELDPFNFPFMYYFFAFSFFNNIAISSTLNDLASRARLLWLKQEGDRKVLWAFIEKHIAIHFVYLFSAIFLSALVALLFSNIASIIIIHYLILIIFGGIFLCYGSLLATTLGIPKSIKGILGIFFMLIVALSIGLVFSKENYIALISLEVILFISAYFSRKHAFINFCKIDWCLLK